MPVSILFARLSQKPSVFRVHPRVADVFVPEDIERCAMRFRPALTVDLSRIRPSWVGSAHFVYLEMGAYGASRFALEGGRYRYLGNFRECDPDVPIEHDVSVRAPYVELVPTQVPLFEEDWTPSPGALNASSLVYPHAKRLVQYWHVVGEASPAPEGDLFFFGHTPNWVQGDKTPLDPDGRPMSFVGQLRADFLTEHAADFQLYLFYSPEHRLVTQILQHN
jgi:hypothetical protein